MPAKETTSNVHDLCQQGKPCALWAARIHDEDPRATAIPATRSVGIMDLRDGDTVSIHGAAFRTIETIRHGWRGNPPAARRAISIRYTNGEGSYFDSAMIRAEVVR